MLDKVLTTQGFLVIAMALVCRILITRLRLANEEITSLRMHIKKLQYKVNASKNNPEKANDYYHEGNWIRPSLTLEHDYKCWDCFNADIHPCEFPFRELWSEQRRKFVRKCCGRPINSSVPLPLMASTEEHQKSQ